MVFCSHGTVHIYMPSRMSKICFSSSHQQVKCLFCRSHHDSLPYTISLGWEEVRGLDVSGQQHGTLWAGQNMNSWKLDSKKRRSVIPRHYWRVSQKRFHFSLILSQNTSIVITSGWEIETCFRLWCKTNLQNGGRNYSMIPGHASLHLIRAIQGPGKDGRWLVRKYIEIITFEIFKNINKLVSSLTAFGKNKEIKLRKQICECLKNIYIKNGKFNW